MRKILIVLLFAALSQASSAQRTKPDSYPLNASVNSVKEWTALSPIADPVTMSNSSFPQVKLTTSFFDGLGRPIETVIKKGSLTTGNSAKDLVSFLEYDRYNRNPYNYLPFPSKILAGSATQEDDGNFKPEIYLQQEQFYNSTNLNENPIANQGELYFYSKIGYEPSPLNRAEKVMPAGNNWIGNNRGTTIKEYLNTDLDDVKIWEVTDVTGNFGNYNITGTYPEGTLFKKITEDESGNQIIEFKDNSGKTLLKKIQIGAATDNGSGIGYTDWLSTYYIFDDLNNLRCVIQPQAVKTISLPANNWILNSSLLSEQCFRYEYDRRNRMIRKKKPGGGEDQMVYDVRDRLVMTQNVNLRESSKWQYIIYDDLNRSIATGLLTDNTNAGNLNYHLSQAYQSANYPDLTSYVTEELTNTFYDDYNWIDEYGWDYPVGLGIWSFFNSFLPPAYVWPYPQASVKSLLTKGTVTGSRVKVLGSDYYLLSANLYDSKERLIQTNSTNITEVYPFTGPAGWDIRLTQYSWNGVPLVINKYQTVIDDMKQIYVITRNSYDDLWRLNEVSKEIHHYEGGNATVKPAKIILHNDFDALGHLTTKKLVPSYNNNAGLETEKFEYNIHGWLLGMNRNYTRDLNNNNFFGFDLGYDKQFNNLISGQSYNAAQYNGNITGSVWKSKGDGEKRKYDFMYDKANRLMKADFTQYNNALFSTNPAVDFSMQMGDYDDNGNILSMKQKGMKINTSSIIDDMRYTYIPNSNRLKSVTDFTNDAITPLGDFRTGTIHPQSGVKLSLSPTSTPAQFDAITDYNYDNDGNLQLDNNKGISSISYNHLNQPLVINVTGKGTITYTYDANGNKIRKLSHENPSATNNNKTINITTNYINGLVYESKATSPQDATTPPDYTDVLQFIPHEEGRIRFKPYVLNNAGTAIIAPTDFAYDYMLKDHLGNVRAVITEELRQDIYPVATLEPSLVTTEMNYYTIDQGKIVPNSAANNLNDISNIAQTYPNKNFPIANNNPSCGTGNLCTTALSAKVYQLNGNTNTTGLGITLRVMAGDKIDIFGKSYYFQDNLSANSSIPITSILSGLLGGVTSGVTDIHGPVTVPDINTPGGVGGITDMFNNQTNQTPPGSTVPRAYINYLFFDDQFKCVGSGFSKVGGNSVLKDHFTELQGKIAPKNGFVYIYCSNESPVNVFFDNLQVVHTRSPILEETHYYPFGLTMAGISSKAAGGIINKKGYNGYELNSDFDINLYETFYRTHDPQIGRFWQLDPKPTDQESLYAAMGNNPIKNTDFLGDTTIYYSSNGIELYRTNDKLTNAVTFVSDQNLAGFNLVQKGLSLLGVDMAGSTVTTVMRSLGETYNTKSVFDYVDGNAKNYTPDKKFSPTDGKGPLVNEASAAVEKKDGAWTVNPAKTDPTNLFPFSSDKVSNGVNEITLHTHDNEGRRFKENSSGQKGTVLTGKDAARKDNSSNAPGTGIFQMAAGKTDIQFYNNTGVVLSLDRNAFSPLKK